MVPFKYHAFWDVPRFIVCTVQGTELLLDAGFDDALDEYSPDYKVYVLPLDLDLKSLYTWPQLPSADSSYLGSIAVSSIEFDPTKRQELESGPLLELLRRRNRASL
jgi:hypothetical protein